MEGFDSRQPFSFRDRALQARSSRTDGSPGDAQVCSAALQAAPARFDTEVVHHVNLSEIGKGSAVRPTVEGGAHWWATGLENQAGVTGVRGPASNALTLRNTTELPLGLVDVIVGA